MDKKTCSKCGVEKPLDDFARNKTKKDGRSYHCKACQKKYIDEHYNNNKDYYKCKARKRDREIAQWFRDFKSELVCEICGEDHISCIEFHHTDPKEKEINLSKAVNHSWGVERLKKEMDKCKVVCSNCHRKIHYEERTGPFANLAR